jgi:glycine oxidase
VDSEVIVVGGGVIGLSIAWRSAQAGLDVTVVDDARPGRASPAAAGMLAPVTEAHYGENPLLELNLAAAGGFPDFVAELEGAAGTAVGHLGSGTLAVAADRDEGEALGRLHRFQTKLGLEVTRLSGSECRALEPGLSPRIRSGILVEGDHQVDNRALLGALEAAGERVGVNRVDSRAEVVIGSGTGRVTGVETSTGEHLAAKRVVVAAGCWSAALPGIPAEAAVPVRPVKGQVVHLRGPGEDPVITRTIRGQEVYLVPRADGRVVVGATVEDVGFDTAVSAGAVYGLLRWAYELVPGIVDMAFTEACAGLRPCTPDNAPVIGPTCVPGLILATGHYRNGILLAPVTADAIVQLLVGGTMPAGMAAFSIDRFSRKPAA